MLVRAIVNSSHRIQSNFLTDSALWLSKLRSHSFRDGMRSLRAADLLIVFHKAHYILEAEKYFGRSSLAGQTTQSLRDDGSAHHLSYYAPMTCNSSSFDTFYESLHVYHLLKLYVSLYGRFPMGFLCRIGS